MRIEIVVGDIVKQHVDAIVNAANRSLYGGGGVDGAIHRAAGPELLAECRDVRATVYPAGLPVGAAVATGAGQLPATWVIHTVGPNAHAGQTDPALLASSFRSSLRIAAELEAASVAFPAISAGAYGWAVATVAGVAAQVVAECQRADGGVAPPVELVRFVLFGAAAEAAFRAAFANPVDL
jgi:O-acetyl-ADP-ribose deacetylase (regulator of RNase III)